MPKRRKHASRNDGFTMVELMIVVAIIGILAAVAGPALSRYVKKSRTVEAYTFLEKMWAGSVTYYNTEFVDQAGDVVDPRFPGPSAPLEPLCCLSPGKKCPGNDSAYDDPTWVALNFRIADPHYFVPQYVAGGTRMTSNFNAGARADQDCDGTLSRFARIGTIDGEGNVVSAGVSSSADLE